MFSHLTLTLTLRRQPATLLETPPSAHGYMDRQLEQNITCLILKEKGPDGVACIQKEYSEVFATNSAATSLALREPVERELKRLQRDEIITKVDRFDYGTPIVPIVKKK